MTTTKTFVRDYLKASKYGSINMCMDTLVLKIKIKMKKHSIVFIFVIIAAVFTFIICPSSALFKIV